MSDNNKILFLTIVIGMLGFLFHILLHYWMTPYAQHGLYFQRWPSDVMMQTLSIEDLRDAPFESLNNLFIQPPMFDVIRAILANIWDNPDGMTLLRNVDRSLYVVGAALGGFFAL